VDENRLPEFIDENVDATSRRSRELASGSCEKLVNDLPAQELDRK
jgi:hypothetical protein